MCEYCEYFTDFDVVSEDDLQAVIDPGFNPQLLIHTTIDVGRLGTLDICGSFTINYCPICGRSLKEN